MYKFKYPFTFKLSGNLIIFEPLKSKLPFTSFKLPKDLIEED
jgi:hypothetical protein